MTCLRPFAFYDVGTHLECSNVHAGAEVLDVEDTANAANVGNGDDEDRRADDRRRPPPRRGPLPVQLFLTAGPRAARRGASRPAGADVAPPRPTREAPAATAALTSTAGALCAPAASGLRRQHRGSGHCEAAAARPPRRRSRSRGPGRPGPAPPPATDDDGGGGYGDGANVRDAASRGGLDGNDGVAYARRGPEPPRSSAPRARPAGAPRPRRRRRRRPRRRPGPRSLPQRRRREPSPPPARRRPAARAAGDIESSSAARRSRSSSIDTMAMISEDARARPRARAGPGPRRRRPAPVGAPGDREPRPPDERDPPEPPRLPARRQPLAPGRTSKFSEYQRGVGGARGRRARGPSSVAFGHDGGDSEESEDEARGPGRRRARRPPRAEALGRASAAFELALVLVLCAVGDLRMPAGLLPAGTTVRTENMDLWVFAMVTLAVASAWQLKVLPDEPGTGSAVFLSRAQANEWKGWMQVAFVAYHYTNAQDVYVPIRWAVSAYVWLTGFGNGVYFWSSADFSVKRFAQQLWRMNFLCALLAMATNTAWIDYYFVALDGPPPSTCGQQRVIQCHFNF